MDTKMLFPSRISAFARLNRLLSGKQYRDARFFILLDENTYNHCLPLLVSHVGALAEAEFFELPVGEESKSIEVAIQLWGALMDSGADRNSVILNLGGGCVSDVGGFVAAAFKRGIRYINIPTTLIGMVDAAIGGKTAVNLGGAKNQVGFFHAPEAVCICPEFLASLPESEIVSGLFEMVKTALLSDVRQYETLLTSMERLHTQGIWQEGLGDAIKHCVDFKSAVTLSDPHEAGVRKILNLGHTFGHGIESFLLERRSPVPHGVAVGMGMVCALYLSVKKLGFSQERYLRYCRTLTHLVDVKRFTLKETEGILSYMRQDKKNREGLILCVLLQDIGVPVIDVAVNENEIRDALLQIGKG